MWPFTRKRELPGMHLEGDGRVLLTMTDEEKAEVRSLFAMIKGPNGGEGAWAIRDDFRYAMTAWALVSYSRSQVLLSDAADRGRVDRSLCLRKALAAATKAYSLHPLPIYMFDVGCLLEMLGETQSARNAFRTFLDRQSRFTPASADSSVLKDRDLDAAIAQARRSIAA